MRTPLVPIADEALRERLNRDKGLDRSMVPLNATPAERRAAQSPGLPDPIWMESHMETKPGYKTTEFWLTLAFGVLIAALTFFTDYAEAAKVPGVVGVVLVAGAKLLGAPLLAWLTVKYNEYRAKVKTAPPVPA